MRNSGSISVYGSDFKRKHTIQKVLFIAIILLLLSLFPIIFLKLREEKGNVRKELRDSFESGAFESAYKQSLALLNDNPLDFTLLSVNGFSAYQIAIAQINNFDTLSYIDNCIWSLRKALLLDERKPQGIIYYVLGKAYYYKGNEYADLAVDYLEKAKVFGFKADDIPEYLGLAYAAIGDFHNSVAAFTLALSGSEYEPSDILLISIAKSYIALDEYDSARAYLLRCIDTSKDSRNITAARLLLGNLLIKTGDLTGAETEFLKIVGENSENAEAFYQLGEIYALGGDLTRARAEWRRSVRVDPAYGPARSRLNMR